MRILIVEDDADTRAFVAQGLGQAGHQVAVSEAPVHYQDTDSR
jgi:two-component system OmpR family response regulator